MIRRHLLALVCAAVLAMAAMFLRRHLDSLSVLVDGAATVNPWVVAVGTGVSVLAVWNRGLLNHAAHGAVGIAVGQREMVGVAAVGFSAQKIVRSGGLSGLAVFVHHGRRRGDDPGVVAGACALVAAASFLALGLLMATTLAILAVSGSLTGWWLLAAAGFAIYAAGTVVVVGLLLRGRSHIERWVVAGHAVAARVRRRPASVPEIGWIDDLFAALAAALLRPRDVVRMVAHALAGKAVGAVMLLIAAASVGIDLTPTNAIVMYTTALGASLISVVPGGIGVVEASVGALLLANGASAPVAGAAVALFRVFDLWLPLLAGAIAVRTSFRTDVETVTGEPTTSPVPLVPAA